MRAAPAGQTCIYCEEPIDEGAVAFQYANGPWSHRACSIRMLIGSVGHQLGRCYCYGGTEEDPPGLTRRQAAEQAALMFLTSTAFTWKRGS